MTGASVLSFGARSSVLALRSLCILSAGMYTATIRVLALGTLLSAPAAAQNPFDFEPADFYPFADYPVGLAVADLNKDDVPDLLSSNHCPPRVICLFNDCEGGFYDGGTLVLPLGSEPGDVVAGDLDGDGDDDFAVVLRNHAAVEVYLHQGAGIFTLNAVLPTPPEPRGLAIGDAGMDGDLDLAVTSQANGTVDVHENDGAGNFPTSTTLSVGLKPQDVVFFDADNDGDADLAVTNHDSFDVDVFTWNGGWTHSQTVPLGANVMPQGLSSGDLDGNGDEDLLVAVNDPTGGFIATLLSSGGTLAAPVLTSAGGLAVAETLVVDLDGDGDLDGVSAHNFSDTIGLHENDGAANWSPAQVENAGLRPLNLAAADFSANARPDVGVANMGSEVGVHLNETDAVVMEITGTCPGTMTMTVSGLTPGGRVACLLAFDCGRFVVPPHFNCGGTVLGTDSTVRVVQFGFADPMGNLSSTFFMPQVWCGKPAQVLDMTSCLPSNVIIL